MCVFFSLNRTTGNYNYYYHDYYISHIHEIENFQTPQNLEWIWHGLDLIWLCLWHFWELGGGPLGHTLGCHQKFDIFGTDKASWSWIEGWEGGWISKGKRKSSRRKREKGKRPNRDFHPDLTSHRHRAHARTTRNETISRLALQASTGGCPSSKRKTDDFYVWHCLFVVMFGAQQYSKKTLRLTMVLSRFTMIPFQATSIHFRLSLRWYLAISPNWKNNW